MTFKVQQEKGKGKGKQEKEKGEGKQENGKKGKGQEKRRRAIFDSSLPLQLASRRLIHQLDDY